jgi:hypothetical protein
VGARFSGPIRIDPKAHPAYCRVFSGSPSCGYSSWGDAVTTHPCKHQGQVWVQLHLYLSYVPAWHITGQPVTISCCCAYSSAKAPLALTIQLDQWFSTWHHICFINHVILKKHYRKYSEMGSPPTYNIACPSTICVSLQHCLVSVDSLCSFELCWAMAVVKEHKSSLEVTGHVVKNYPPPQTTNMNYFTCIFTGLLLYSTQHCQRNATASQSIHNVILQIMVHFGWITNYIMSFGVLISENSYLQKTMTTLFITDSVLVQGSNLVS